MPKIISQSRAEDAIAAANSFLQRERGEGLDGDFAARQVEGRVLSVAEQVEDLLTSVPHPELSGLYVPLSRFNASRYDEAVSALPGYFVLLPSRLVDKTAEAAFYPAVVSEDSLVVNALRLHVLEKPWRANNQHAASVILAGAGQSETEGIGAHGRTDSDGVEAEHFATLLSIANDQKAQAAWQSGQHINHQLRKRPDSSVTSIMSRKLFGSEVPQTTITLSRQQFKQGAATLLWHAKMRDTDTGRPETAAQDNALLVVQALGYQALSSYNPQALDNVRRLIA